MKNKKSTFVTLSICTALSFSTLLPGLSFAAEQQTRLYQLDRAEQQKLPREAQDILKKITPYVQKKDGKITLTTHDLQTLNLSQEELTGVEQGLAMAEHIKITAPNTISSSASTQQISASIDEGQAVINLTHKDIKVGLIVGAVAATIAGIVAFILGGVPAVIVGGLVLTGAILTGVIGTVLASIMNVEWIYATAEGISVVIPLPTFEYGSGQFYIWYQGNYTVYTI
ncbi:hypothetical protein Q0N88_28420 [Bacillus thuringiensis]|uniref:hypothetical protein n=1 Tax=Bacillus thuringiensis TaxID=1428 RepID=UPI003457DAA4